MNNERKLKYELAPGVYHYSMVWNGVRIEIPGTNEGYSYKYEALGIEIVNDIDEYKKSIENFIKAFFPVLKNGFIRSIFHIVFDKNLDGEQFRMEFGMETTDGYLTMAAIFQNRKSISMIEMCVS